MVETVTVNHTNHAAQNMLLTTDDYEPGHWFRNLFNEDGSLPESKVRAFRKKVWENS